MWNLTMKVYKAREFFLCQQFIGVELHNVNHPIQAWIPTLPPPHPYELLYKKTQVYIKLK